VKLHWRVQHLISCLQAHPPYKLEGLERLLFEPGAPSRVFNPFCAWLLCDSGHGYDSDGAVIRAGVLFKRMTDPPDIKPPTLEEWKAAQAVAFESWAVHGNKHAMLAWACVTLRVSDSLEDAVQAWTDAQAQHGFDTVPGWDGLAVDMIHASLEVRRFETARLAFARAAGEHLLDLLAGAAAMEVV
jgi:hypothetical protein